MAPSRLLNNSRATCDEDCVVAIVEGQLDFDGAVILQLGRSVSTNFVSLVKAAPAEKHDAAAIFEFARSIDGAENKFGPAVIGDLEIGRFDEIEVVAIPQIGLDDPPPANQLAGRAGHGDAAMSLGARTKCRRTC